MGTLPKTPPKLRIFVHPVFKKFEWVHYEKGQIGQVIEVRPILFHNCVLGYVVLLQLEHQDITLELQERELIPFNPTKALLFNAEHSSSIVGLSDIQQEETAESRYLRAQERRRGYAVLSMPNFRYFFTILHIDGHTEEISVVGDRNFCVHMREKYAKRVRQIVIKEDQAFLLYALDNPHDAEALETFKRGIG